MTIGVIISTYNNHVWLEKTLWGYMCQLRPADEIIIADDGSKPETRDMVKKYENSLPIKYVWHEDKGFRKTKILNEALKVAESDYLIFTDQDCIPRNDFIATHESHARHGHFLSGGYFRLPMSISQEITQDDIASQQVFQLKWLRQHGLKLTFKSTKRNRFYQAICQSADPGRLNLIFLIMDRLCKLICIIIMLKGFI